MESGRFAELVDRLDAYPSAELERSPTLTLLLSIAHARMGRLDQCQQWAVIALKRAREQGDQAVEARALNVCGAAAMESGRLNEATGHFMRAQAVADGVSDHATIGRSCSNLGIIANMRGEYGQAVGWYQAAMAAYQRADLDHGCAETYHNLGITYHYQGALVRAHRNADLAVEMACAMEDGGLRAKTLAGRAEIRVALDQADVARREVSGALQTHRELGDVVGEAEDLRILGLATGALGQVDDADELLRDVIRRANEHGRPLLAATAGRDLCLILHRAGRIEDATVVAMTAKQQFNQLGAEAEVRRLEQVLAPLD